MAIDFAYQDGIILCYSVCLSAFCKGSISPYTPQCLSTSRHFRPFYAVFLAESSTPILMKMISFGPLILNVNFFEILFGMFVAF